MTNIGPGLRNATVHHLSARGGSCQPRLRSQSAISFCYNKLGSQVLSRYFHDNLLSDSTDWKVKLANPNHGEPASRLSDGYNSFMLEIGIISDIQ